MCAEGEGVREREREPGRECGKCMAGSAGQMWQAMGERRAAEQAMHEWESSEPVRNVCETASFFQKLQLAGIFSANSLQGYFLWVFITHRILSRVHSLTFDRQRKYALAAISYRAAILIGLSVGSVPQW